ncbi:hypothetical protein PtA15_11A594 [Puccinia triticina]|uniref:Uncharacterized protein n=1 Tax=Puccinia triticina TaxID=208348 RepID=A0ABY7CZP0_9BASI|nr:uncharacterized protein PtA15_11A594 [Puccinia triticina]WAQ89902.1 hypothetical protein PtA15_11A594 [Puccinia triticina]WAR59948.1 hypothetical protein PtB15_11B589 [Puccinia triticina]
MSSGTKRVESKPTVNRLSDSQAAGVNVNPSLSASQPSAFKAAHSKPNPGSTVQPPRKLAAHPGKRSIREQSPADEITVIDEMASITRRDCAKSNATSIIGGANFIELSDTSDSEDSTCADTTAVAEEDVKIAIGHNDGLEPEDSTINHVLGNDDRERLWKCAMDADLRGDLAASEMFCRLLKVQTKPVDASAKPSPSQPVKHRPPPVATVKQGHRKRSRTKTPATSSTLQKKEETIEPEKKVDEAVEEEGILFVTGAVSAHTRLKEPPRSTVPDLYPELNASPRPYRPPPADVTRDADYHRSARGGVGIDRGRDRRSEPAWDPTARGPSWTETYLITRDSRRSPKYVYNAQNDPTGTVERQPSRSLR